MISRADGKQVSPMTHMDSVFNSDGVKIDNLLAPIEHIGATGNIEIPDGKGGTKVVPNHPDVTDDASGFMTPEQKKTLESASQNAYEVIYVNSERIPAVGHDTFKFLSGKGINLVHKNDTEKSVTINHNTFEFVRTQTSEQLLPGSTVLVQTGYSVDEFGHVQNGTEKSIVMPITVRVNETLSEQEIKLLGSSDRGNATVHSSDNLTFNQKTGILSSPIIDSNMLGGGKGSIPYQLDSNVTTFVSIGSETQVLRSVDGVPKWTGDNGVKSFVYNNDGDDTSGSTAVITRIDGTTVNVPAMPVASIDKAGVITTGAQVISGEKTFQSGIKGHINNLTGGTKGSIVYQTAPDTTTHLPIGSNKQILKVSADGVPVWANDKGLTKSVWKAGTTSGPVLSQTLVDSSIVDSTPIPAASASSSGVITTGEQSFSGNKTFENNVVVAGDFTVLGNTYVNQETDLLVADKVISVAYTTNATVDSGDGGGLEVVTQYDGTQTTERDKYRGPNLLWDKTLGWTTGNTDSEERSLDINLGGPNAVYRIDGVEVMSPTQYVGNSKSSDKVNHKITFHSLETFDGSEDITVNYDSVGASKKNHASTTTAFGVASKTDYGHVRIGDGILVSNGVISSDYGASATALGPTQNPGVSTRVSRADHVHPLPNINDTVGVTNVAHGGTGLSSVTANAILIGNGTGNMKVSNVGSKDQALLIDSTGVPTFKTLSMSHISDFETVPRMSDTGMTCPDFVVGV